MTRFDAERLPVQDMAAMVAALEMLYPPRCMARLESIEDHLRYAGKAELVQMLREALTTTQEGNDDEEGDDE